MSTVNRDLEYTLDDLLWHIRHQCEIASQKALAEKWGVSPQYLNDVLRGRREPGPALLEAWKLEKVVYYRPKPLKGKGKLAHAADGEGDE